ncbi:hypothetical protein QR680_014497 [Steinernema hermaphroditum]|uniref:Peptidase S1 domain-containing protein n=1 Tax=Steinernema hermaphroditum TaxID=289476 RepID=A0AA39I926_9BILA|nr:hypothetical protein QR680_014497 [Steinernema hermaphroditum]
MGFLPLLFCLFCPALALPLQGETSLLGRRIQDPALHPATFESFKKLADEYYRKNELIFNGDKVQAGQIPMQAAIIYNSTDDNNLHICGGTLISKTHILTAAHCTVFMTAPAKIMVGGVELFKNSTNTQWRFIHRVHTHHDYDDDDKDILNDIGIVEFSPAIELNADTKLANIVKDDNEYLMEGWGVASGFGNYEYRGKYKNVSSGASAQLRATDLTIYSFDYCVKARLNTKLSFGQFCAGAKGKGIGKGDSGGPISAVRPGKLVQLGIASYGAVSPRVYLQQDKYPAVFTKVSHYCDYIKRTTRNAAECQ